VLAPDRGRLPVPRALSALDPDQYEAAHAVLDRKDVLVHSGPGAGRTSLVLAAALALVDGTRTDTGDPSRRERGNSGDEGPEPGVLLLSPRRGSADALRDAVALAGRASRIRVATPAAQGFATVRAAGAAEGRADPTLVTGADQDALLRELIDQRTDWALDVDATTRLLPGFRTELRDVITRANELGLGPADLEALAARRGRAAWYDAAALLRGYLDVLDLEGAGALDAGPRLDSGALVRRGACAVTDLPAHLLPRAVLVDDAQDLTAAGCELVVELARAGASVLLASCPDESVDTFRGALPDAATRIVDRIPRPVRRVRLGHRYRGRGDLVRGLDAVRARLPLAGASSELRRPGPQAPGPDPDGTVRSATVGTGTRAEDDAGTPGTDDLRTLAVLTAASPSEEAQLIASALRELHHGDAVDYDDMAVVCRSGALVDQVSDLLGRAGLRVVTPDRSVPLRDERVVADLLEIVELGSNRARGHETVPQATAAASLLRGPFGDADTLRLRRIRRDLLDGHRGGQEQVPDSGELLARALVLDEVPGLPAPNTGDRGATPVHRIRRMIRAVADLGPAPGAAQALWAAWDAARVADGWQRAALGEQASVAGRTDTSIATGGEDGEVDLEGLDARARQMGHRLDAITALFASAERFTERRGEADALVFIDHIRTLSVAEDTLGPGAAPRGRVAVLTPTQLAGAERDTVVLARVQDGAWPNTRLRSTLFGAAELSLVAGRARDEDLPTGGAALRAIQREQVIADELRLMVSALSRARARVLVTAVDDGESAPSALVDLLRDLAGDGWIDTDRLMTDPGPAPDARRLVAALRRRLSDPDPARAEQAAALLRELAAEGAPGADPERWYHQSPTSAEPLSGPEDTVTLSPSALERAEACPQAWLLERAGGSRPSGPAQLIGTAIHRLAQEHPEGVAEDELEDLVAQLHELVAPAGLEQTWSGRRHLRQAEDAIGLLQMYLRTAPAAAGVETPFEVTVGRVRLRGVIDRIEGRAHLEHGAAAAGAGAGVDTDPDVAAERAGTAPARGGPDGIRVVDLKTGKSAKSAKDAEKDLQLAAYQTALRGGALADVLGADAPDRLAGAQLVYVGTGATRPAIRTQGALHEVEDPGWFDAVVDGVAEQVGGSRVRARRNAHCDMCTVRRTCALWAEGAEL
jgi:superfamily I DNA/RNA helicase/RecB family exonuclease